MLQPSSCDRNQCLLTMLAVGIVERHIVAAAGCRSILVPTS